MHHETCVFKKETVLGPLVWFPVDQSDDFGRVVKQAFSFCCFELSPF